MNLQDIIDSRECEPPPTHAGKIAWPYEEYYLGERDNENRKNGMGEHHWSGAQSLPWYTGIMLRDTMHGLGDYRCRYRGPKHTANTYEGHFYNNEMHGYGTMSFADGRVFNGLFHRNIRWGPGVESFADLHENVGFWVGAQLLRLAWVPSAENVTFDISTSPIGRSIVQLHRILLMVKTKNIGEVNSALEILKQHGADPLVADEKWPKLYPKHCTDQDSLLFHVDVFDDAYYDKQINTLEVITDLPKKLENGEISRSKFSVSKDLIKDYQDIYYAWNNNEINIHQMSHCFKHDKQLMDSGVPLVDIISGQRNKFKNPAPHEQDCRTLLMSSYLGLIQVVAPLINENNVHPNISDGIGNTALMYAACGNQPKIIHFLVDAGANVDSYNDCCCTPLGVTLLLFACTRKELTPKTMMQAILPLTLPEDYIPIEYNDVQEWNIKKEVNVLNFANKTNKTNVGKETNGKKPLDKAYNQSNYDLDYRNKRLSINTVILEQYVFRVNEAFNAAPNPIIPVPFIFDVNDMINDINLADSSDNPVADKSTKKGPPIKNIKKEPSKISKVKLQSTADFELDFEAKLKQEREDRVLSTILQLLVDGADPRKVQCPYTALMMAIVAGCSDLVRHLAHYGANVNEICVKSLGYSAIDVAISGPLSQDNVEVVRALLENGARVDHLLKIQEVADEPDAIPEPGPTLLHAVIAKSLTPENEEELNLQLRLLQLLLNYGCNPLSQYRGRSSIDMAMTKSMDMLDPFIRSPRTNLNGVINQDNQTILVKMFYIPFCHNLSATERIQTLTDLLLFGADPLLGCQNGELKYNNLIEFARYCLENYETFKVPEKDTGKKDNKSTKSDVKPKKPEKSVKEVPAKGGAGAKSKMGGLALEISDYEQTLDLVVECARLLFIRWIQAKLMKNIVDLVCKYQHRHWNIIMREYKNGKCTGLWLTAPRCLEIWDIMTTTRKKPYKDRMILRYVMCIVHYYYKKSNNLLKDNKLTFEEKVLIETEVIKLIHEHEMTAILPLNKAHIRRPYVTPELAVKEEKFNVCFECISPFIEEKIKCTSCKLVSFCSLACLKLNTARPNCHPCREYLRQKYNIINEESEILTMD